MTKTTQPPLEKHPERIDMQDERFDEATRQRHLARYDWAARTIKERLGNALRVIDYACGTGYGSAKLATVAKDVYGRDKAHEAIAAAERAYGHIEGLNFKVRDRIELHPGDSPSFDAVVSIETIEHLEDPAGFLREAYKLLLPGGLLLVSTPEARENRFVENPHHLREYTGLELTNAILEAGFHEVTMDGWLPGFLCAVAVKKGPAQPSAARGEGTQ